MTNKPRKKKEWCLEVNGLAPLTADLPNWERELLTAALERLATGSCVGAREATHVAPR
jgi:hypothetical protein